MCYESFENIKSDDLMNGDRSPIPITCLDFFIDVTNKNILKTPSTRKKMGHW